MYALGVDLGTVYTAAATWRDGHAEIVSLGSRAATIPSVVLLREDASFLTGDAANRRALIEPGRVAREFKRRFGDSTPIMLGGTPHSPEALMGRLLQSVVAEVTSQQGEPPAALCVCHPANWGPYKTDLLQQAIRMADFNVPTTLAVEPVAAAAYYARQQRVEDGSLVAVYDLGGGTFDAAVVRKTGDSYEIIGRPEGIEHLGGADFDAAVFEHVRSVVGEPLGRLDDSQPSTIAAVARLRDECTSAKETLSSDTDTTIPVLLPGHATEVRLTRAELERMVRPSLYDTISALQRAIRSAGVTPAELHSVLLIGGSSRMPLVAQLVGAEVDRPVAVDAHPKHAVALGAAWMAGSAAAVTAPQATAPPLTGGPGSRPAVPATPPPSARPAVPATPPAVPAAGPAVPVSPAAAASLGAASLGLGSAQAAPQGGFGDDVGRPAPPPPPPPTYGAGLPPGVRPFVGGPATPQPPASQQAPAVPMQAPANQAAPNQAAWSAAPAELGTPGGGPGGGGPGGGHGAGAGGGGPASGQPAPVAGSRPSPWTRPWVVATATALAVLAIVFPGAWLLGQHVGTSGAGAAASTPSGTAGTAGTGANVSPSKVASSTTSGAPSTSAASTIYTCPTAADAAVWACLTSAHANQGRLAIEFTTNFQLSAVQDAAHYHFHLFLANPAGDTTDPQDKIMQHVENPGSWFIIYDNDTKTIDADTEKGGQKKPLDLDHYQLFCVRVASGLHGLANDVKGGFRTGNCVKITK